MYDDALRKTGIRSTQYALMKCIETADNATVGDLSAALCMEQSTATRNVELLRERGYVSFSPHARDARKKILSLTDSGRIKLEEAASLWREAQDRIRESMGEKGMENLLAALNNVVGIARNI